MSGRGRNGGAAIVALAGNSGNAEEEVQGSESVSSSENEENEAPGTTYSLNATPKIIKQAMKPILTFIIGRRTKRRHPV